MAYAKTTPAHVISQLIVGGGVGFLAWKSLVKPKPLESEKIAITAEALEAEALANTTGQIWRGDSTPKLLNKPTPSSKT